MKKVQDWEVMVTIVVLNHNKKVQLICSIHHNIHQIKLQLLKQLKLPVLDVTLDIYYRSSQPLKSLTTLLQNQIKSNVTLTANINRIPHGVDQNSEINKIGRQVRSISEAPKRKQKYFSSPQNESAGLTIISSCTNQGCIYFNKLTQINLGFGTFPIDYIISTLKCQICPYKNQKIRVSMMCHSILISNCFYKLEGKRLSCGVIPIKQQTKFIKVTQQRNIVDFLNKKQWNIDKTLIIKHL